jgi:ribonuclease D
MEWIDQPDALNKMLDRARTEGSVAVDTEFVWERTYYPQLGLIQFGFSNGDAALVDPLAFEDLSAIGTLMADASVVKLLHDAHQDLTIIQRACGGQPANCFDTRLASGFVGLTAILSLSKLLLETLGIEIEKGETRSNWVARPLRDAQKEYAALDVSHLHDAWRELNRRAEALGRTAWVADEMKQFNDPALFVEREPETRYTRIKGFGRLKPREQAVLRELAIWREAEAEERDVPRGFVVRDPDMIEIVKTLPQNLGEFKELARGKRGLNRYQQGIMEALRIGMQLPSDEWPTRKGPPTDRSLDKRVSTILGLLREYCEARQLDATLVSTRSDMTTFLAAENAQSDSPLAKGWRKDVVQVVLD